MIRKNKQERAQMEIFSIEEYVPKDHLLRKIDTALDFTHIYDFVNDLYSENNGRPSIDPVVLFKMILIQHLYGIPSLRRTCEEIKMNVAFKWFLGYLMNEPIPHFSTISYNFKHRFTAQTIDEVFYWILSEIERAGYLSPEAVFVDGTHIKANANMKKVVKKAIPAAARMYEEQLLQEINEDREKNNKKPFDKNNKPLKDKVGNVSATDPDSGIFHKGEHKKCLAYEAHTACDKHGYIMEVEVTPGNVHDSKAFDGLYDRLVEKHPAIETIVADSAYKTPWICKKIIDDGRIPSMPYVKPKGKKKTKRHEWWKYAEDSYYNCVICPEFKVLGYATTNRDGYREYKSKSYICKQCSTRHLCTENVDCIKTVSNHIWSDYIELAEDYRHTPKYKELYALRKETIERVFADAKEKDAMRYTLLRGLPQVTNWVRLKFAAMNLKKLAIHKWNCFSQFHFLLLFTKVLFTNQKNPCSLFRIRGFSTV